MVGFIVNILSFYAQEHSTSLPDRVIEGSFQSRLVLLQSDSSLVSIDDDPICSPGNSAIHPLVYLTLYE